MPASILKRPRAEERARDRPTKKVRKFKKQLDYHSSSDEDNDDDDAVTDFQAVNLQDSDEEDRISSKQSKSRNASKFVVDEDEDEDEPFDDEDGKNGKDDDDDDGKDDAASDITGASSDSELSETSTAITEGGTKRKKRNDPTAFATSISKILTSKLTTQKRADPVLSRSASAAATSKALSDSKLDLKARQKLRAERKKALERGRVRDVLALEDEAVSTEGIIEKEKRLRKTAQRGVVKLFNAVGEAQRKGEAARQGAVKEGVVGMGRREEKVSEMSKKGFLDLISSGGKKVGVKA